MNYLQYSDIRRKRIETALNLFFDKKSKATISIRFHKDVLERLREFCTKGKLMRGIFVFVAYEMCGGAQPTTALRAACALEIVHTGLLIHDDIMDRDTLRRGLRTIYMQYADSASRQTIRDPILYGESMGISAGDIAFFLANELLTDVHPDSVVTKHVNTIFSREMVKLGVAQMEDVHLGSASQSPKETEIIEMYRYKSARYSFSLPFEIGATLAAAPRRTINLLTQLGEQIGIIFQLKDDEIGLFGTAKRIGKSVGIDIRANKKTLHRKYCLDAATPVERHALMAIFGNVSASDNDIEYVMQIMVKYNIRERVEAVMKPYETKAYQIIQRLETHGMNTSKLRGIVELNMSRTK